MKRAILIIVAALAFPASAAAGIDSPLHHAGPLTRLKDAAIPGHRCPKLTNPIECTGDNGKGSEDHRSNNSVFDSGQDKHESPSCRWDEMLYRLRHPVKPPRELSIYHGCYLWKLDADYHSAREHLSPVDHTILGELGGYR